MIKEMPTFGSEPSIPQTSCEGFTLTPNVCRIMACWASVRGLGYRFTTVGVQVGPFLGLESRVDGIEVAAGIRGLPTL